MQLIVFVLPFLSSLCISHPFQSFPLLEVSHEIQPVNEEELPFLHEAVVSPTYPFDQDHPISLVEKAGLIGDTSLFRILVAEGNVSIEGPEVFLRACAKGNYEIVDAFLPPNPKVTMKFVEMWSVLSKCLWEASRGEHVAVLEALHRVDELPRMDAALSKALKSNSTVVFPVLLSLLEKHEEDCEDGRYWAACMGELRKVKKFHRKCPSIRPNSMNPLVCAIEHGHDNVVDFFLKWAKADDRRQRDLYYNTEPIKVAIKSGHVQMAQKVLKGIPRDMGVVGPLVLAAASGNMEMVHWAEAWYNAFDILFRGPTVDVPAEEAANLEVLQYLFNNYNVTLKTKGFKNAASLGKIDMLQFYVEQWRQTDRIIDVELMNDLLERAFLRVHLDAVRYLIQLANDQGIQANLVPQYLSDSLLESDISVVQQFLDESISNVIHINIQELFNEVVGKQKPEFLNALIERWNVDPAAEGNKALFKAISSGALENVKFLISLIDRFPDIRNALGGNRVILRAIDSSDYRMLSYFVHLKSKYPEINLAEDNNAALKEAVHSEKDHLVEYLISLPDEYGIDRELAVTERKQTDDCLV